MKKTFKNIISDFVSSIMYKYISFVYKTSKLDYIGFDRIESLAREGVVFAFWHGDSFSLYPALNGRNLLVITTKDRRGDFIAETCQKFGYGNYRMPDTSNSKGTYVLGLVRRMSGDNSDLAISLDGPLGPYHVPKIFPFAIAYLLKRSIIPISVTIGRKVVLKNRWDNFKIPLPYNKITVTFHDNVTLAKNDKEEDFISVINIIKEYE